MNQWNNAKDKLPTSEFVADDDFPGYDAYWCFVISDDDGVYLAYYDSEADIWYNNLGFEIKVAYWMLPPSLDELNESIRRNFS